MMTIEEIRAADNRQISVAEIRALLAKITPGPWAYSANDNRFFSTGLFGSRTIDPSVSDNYAHAGMQVMDVVRNTIRPDDAAFIAKAPEIVELLLAEVENANKRIAELKMDAGRYICACDGLSMRTCGGCGKMRVMR